MNLGDLHDGIDQLKGLHLRRPRELHFRVHSVLFKISAVSWTTSVAILFPSNLGEIESGESSGTAKTHRAADASLLNTNSPTRAHLNCFPGSVDARNPAIR